MIKQKTTLNNEYRVKKTIPTILLCVFLPLIVMGIICGVFYAILYINLGIENGDFLDYNGYQSIELPTNTASHATIKIPNAWEIKTESGWVKIIDSNTKKVIGEQIYENRSPDWIGGVEPQPSTYVYNDGIKLDITNKDKYKYVNSKSLSSLCEFTDNGKKHYVIIIETCSYTNDVDRGVTVYSAIIFYEQQYSTMEKVLKSIRSGAYVSGYYPDDSTYN